MYKNISKASKQDLNLATITVDQTNRCLTLSGDWNWVSIQENMLTQLDSLSPASWQIDGQQINAMDTTGIYFVHRVLRSLTTAGHKVTNLQLLPEDQRLFDLTKDLELGNSPKNLADELANEQSFPRLREAWATTIQMLTFFGQLCQTFATLFKKEYSLYVQGILETVAGAGIKGIIISSMLCFLIGVNLTYQMAPQFVTYGANVYVVNFLGIALLREVTPLLTAIIVAGRTGSAIAASIGTMKVQEEIDALQTMGISPMRRLVVPRVIGLILSLPVLTMLADVASMLGGMIFAGPLLDVDPSLFLMRLQSYVSINNFWVGIVKSFFFAWIIGMVGCFCGFKVKANADSIGTQTTRSVVLSICLIITVDALFAILFKFLGV